MSLQEAELLSSSEVAQALGVTPQTITRLARSGELNCTMVGSRRVFTRASLETYLAEHNLCRAPADHPRATGNLPNVVAVSFFSGALGLDIGMEQAGIHPLLYCENDAKCRMTIASNRPDAALVGDINRVSAEEVRSLARIPEGRSVDVMFGGPPCQAFSTAGARRAFDDSRGNVFLKYLDLAEQLQPTYLVIENVRGLLSTAYPLRPNEAPVRGGAMRLVLNRLKRMGYGVSFNLYNAANFGAPQIRERVVIIAKKTGETVPWLVPTHTSEAAWDLPAWRTLGDALATIDGPQHYVQFPEKRLRYFKMLSAGQYWKDLPANLQEQAMGKAYRLSGGKTGFYRRLRFDRPCATLVTSPTMPATDLCHPTEDRPLSVEEYQAIQEFPHSWVFRGSIQDRYRQIGNAVPIALGTAIGRTILSDIHDSESARAQADRFLEFPYSRYKNSNQLTWNLAQG